MSSTEWSREGDAWNFLEALCELAAGEWLGTASRLRSSAQSEAARRELSTLVTRDGFAVSVWYLNDGLETVEWHVLQHFDRAGLSRRHALLPVAMEAARTAALALLVRPHLGEKRFWLLYEPFQRICPQRRLLLKGSASRVFMKSLCATGSGCSSVQGSSRSHRQ